MATKTLVYDPQIHEDAVAAAEAVLEEAISAWPVVQAAIRLQLAREARFEAAEQENRRRAKLGILGTVPGGSRGVEIEATVRRVVANQARASLGDS